jgi:hypothetical protein
VVSGQIKEGLAVQHRLIVGAEERLLTAMQSVAANTQTLLDANARQPATTTDAATQTTPPAALPPTKRYGSVSQPGLFAAAPANDDSDARPVDSARRKRSPGALSRQRRPTKKAHPSHTPAVSLFSGLAGGSSGGGSAPSACAPQPYVSVAAEHSVSALEAPADDAASKALARRLHRHRQMLLRQAQSKPSGAAPSAN